MSHLSLIRIFENQKKYETKNANKIHRVQIGSKVKLLDKQTQTLSQIILTEQDNTNPHSGRISHRSALGSELLGAVPGQNISVDVMGSSIKFQVLSVSNTQPRQRR